MILKCVMTNDYYPFAKYIILSTPMCATVDTLVCSELCMLENISSGASASFTTGVWCVQTFHHRWKVFGPDLPFAINSDIAVVVFALTLPWLCEFLKYRWSISLRNCHKPLHRPRWGLSLSLVRHCLIPHFSGPLKVTSTDPVSCIFLASWSISCITIHVNFLFR